MDSIFCNSTTPDPEEAILYEKSAIAILSADNLPYPLPEGLSVFALVASANDPERIQSDHLIERSHIIDTSPLKDYFAIIGRENRKDLLEIFKNTDERKQWGKVILAGFGPGDPGLITRKAEAALQQADVIFHDDLLDNDWLARFSAGKYYVGKRKGKHSFRQEDINELIYQTAIQGKRVVRLKGGDPLIFGRGAEEYHYLASRLVEAEIIPGISSAIAAAADEVVPLTARGVSSSVAFLSGHNLTKLVIPKADTLVFYMGASNQKELASRLIQEGWRGETPVAIVRNASLPDRKSVKASLAKLAQNGSELISPVIIIVGQSAAVSSTHQPKKWLFTGTNPRDFNGEGMVIHTPVIEIEPVQESSEIEVALQHLEQFDRIIFTSRYAVEHFFEHLFKQGKDARDLSALKLTSIGRVTSAALRKHGLLVDPASENESSEGILEALSLQGVNSDSILIPRSDKGLPILPDGLEKLGNKVTRLVVYRVHEPEAIVRHNLDDFYGVVFTSPSTVTNFLKMYGGIPSRLKVVFNGGHANKRWEKWFKQTVERKVY